MGVADELELEMLRHDERVDSAKVYPVPGDSHRLRNELRQHRAWLTLNDIECAETVTVGRSAVKSYDRAYAEVPRFAADHIPVSLSPDAIRLLRQASTLIAGNYSSLPEIVSVMARIGMQVVVEAGKGGRLFAKGRSGVKEIVVR